MMSTLITTVFTFATATMGFLGTHTWSAAKVLAVLLALINIKTLPLMWHFRFYRSLYAHFLLRRKDLPKPTHLFSPVTTLSRSSTYECDLNGHKSNSTYFSDLDIARTHLVCHLTKHSFALRKQRGDPLMYVALAGVTALFRREIKPFARYMISTRVLAWDQKWFYVVSHFVSVDKGRDGKRALYASALSKYVFKSKRITVPPEIVLRESGLLPPRPEGATPLESGSSSGVDTPAVGLPETRMGEEKLEAAVERIAHVDRVKEDAERELVEQDGYWTWDRIESERKRGLDLAQHMVGLDGLADEFREGDEEGLETVGPFFAGW